MAQSRTQDSDLFELDPIIATMSRENMSWNLRIAEVEEEVEVMGRKDSSTRYKRALIFNEAEKDQP